MKSFSRLKRDIALICAVLLFCALVFIPTARFLIPAHAQGTKLPLGTAATFAVLGASAVTNTGPTVVNGDLGVKPQTSVTGFPPGIVNGSMHIADAVALQAKNDVATAFIDATRQACDVDLTGQDLGGKTLTPGVYCFSSSAQLTGQLQLNSLENPDSVFIFQIGSTLTTASNASVLQINGTQACNIFWQVGSSATVGTNTNFSGNILSLSSITAQTGAVFDGSLYARTGAVTLDTNTITRATCAVPTPTATATSPATVTPTTTSTSTPTSFPTALPTSTVTSTATATSTSTPTSFPTALPTSTPTSTPTGPPGLPPTGSDPAGSAGAYSFNRSR